MGFMTSYDRNNVPLFEKRENSKYLCSMCGQYTTLNESISYKGYNLICCRCEWKISNILGYETTAFILDMVHKKGKLTELLMNANVIKEGENDV